MSLTEKESKEIQRLLDKARPDISMGLNQDEIELLREKSQALSFDEKARCISVLVAMPGG